METEDGGGAPETLRIVTIEFDGVNAFTVRDGDRFCPHLCWDEMVGTVVELTHPALGEARYPLRTQAEWDDYERRRAERLGQFKQEQST